jgi:hypothetical protein
MSKETKYIVVYDDGDCLCITLSFDPECEGALCCLRDGSAALFATRDSARRAIRISTKFAELCKTQGKPANDDFLKPGIKNVKIVVAREA